MALGDSAVAAGMEIVSPTDDRRDGADEITRTRDHLGDHILTGTHGAEAITTGTLDEDRLPVIPVGKVPDLDASKITTGTIDEDRLPSLSANANGPTSAAYNRSQTGSGWFSTWMNSALQFMRNTSSRRYKKNIRDWHGSALELRPVIFDRRGDDTPDNEVGFIAEEVLPHIPEAIAYFDGKVDGIYDRAIIAALVGDIKRLHARVTELEQKGAE